MSLGIGGGAALQENANAAAPARSFTFSPSCTINAVTTGKVLAATEVIAVAGAVADLEGLIKQVSCLRKDSTTGIDFRLWFLCADVALGTEGSDVSITDTDAENVLGFVDFVAADFKSLVGSAFAQPLIQVQPPYKPLAGTKTIAIAIEAKGSIDLAAASDLFFRVQVI